MAKVGVFIAALVCAIVVVICSEPAWATTEFCPATLELQPIGSGNEWHIGDYPAQLYGFELVALGARAVSARLAFDTKAGWYIVDVPAVSLSPKLRHYGTRWTKYMPQGTRFTRRVFISPRMYVAFPSIVWINHAYIYSAKAENDEAGWQAKGIVKCPPVPEPDAQHPPLDSPVLDLKDSDHLSGSPSSDAMILSPKPSVALESSSCPVPFKPVTPKNIATPDYPEDTSLQRIGNTTALIDL